MREEMVLSLKRSFPIEKIVKQSDSGFGGKLARLSLVLAITGLSACTTLTPDPEPEVQPIKIDMAALPGDYGLASYHQDEDQERTLQQAKIACNNPYTIGTGANGGVMMHAVGAKQTSEIFLKTDRKGRVFLGPRGAAGIEQDRYVVSYDERVLVVRWMEPRARTVFGTMIYVPCGQP